MRSSARGERVDRVVLARQRAVAARILHRERHRMKDLLGGLNVEQRVLAVLDLAAARVDVDRVLGVDQRSSCS